MIHRLNYADASEGILVSISNTADNSGWVGILDDPGILAEYDTGRVSPLTELQEAAAEQELARSRSTLLLDEFRRSLDSDLEDRPIVVVRPSPSLATVPWGLIEIEPGVRLMERARVIHGLPLGLEPKREHKPDQLANAIAVIDPHTTQAPVLNRGQRRRWTDSIGPGWDSFRPGGTVTRIDLSHKLSGTMSPAFLFFGHCLVAEGDTAGLSAQSGILLSDRGEPDAPGDSESLILTARELAIGTLSQHQPGLPDSSPGPDLWPMPPVVAVIGCGSGGDHRFAEPFGLAAALRNNGANQIVATLWDLQTDNANYGATSHMGLAVAEALVTDDPIAALDRWRLGQLRLWRETGELRYSPATWGALAVFDSPDVISCQ